LDWEKAEGVLPPELCDEHEHEEGTPMLLEPATSRNVSRAIREINAFEWKGDVKPMGRQALKDLLVGTERFPTKLFERYARRCRSVDKVLLACFCLGLSTRKAASVLVPVLGEKVSASTISRIALELDGAVAGYHSRALKDQYRYLFFDGVVLKSKGALKVQKRILLCSFGITTEGRQEMIDFYPAASESGASWEAFLTDLYKRGLKASLCQLIASDGGTGLHQAVEIVYPKITLQRCWAHKTRNVSDKVKRSTSRQSKAL
jgi:transposase-like protein